MDPSRDADAPWFGKLFQPCSDVDAIAKEIGPRDHDIALVDSYPHFDRFHGGRVGIALMAAPLHSYRGFEPLNRAREPSEQSVAHQLEDAPAMLGHYG